MIDIGSDLRMDLAAAIADGIELFRQSDQGVLESIGILRESTFGCSTADFLFRSLSVGDLNADGYQDLVIQNSCRQHMEVFFQLPDGSLELPVVNQPEPDGFFGMLKVADLTGDGLDDILVATPAHTSDKKARLIVFPGRIDGIVEPGLSIELDGVFGIPLIATADLNQDGRIDVVAISRSLFVYVQSESGELVLHQTLEHDFFARFVAILDIDGDGRPDIYSNDSSRPIVYWQLNTGTFTAAENIDLPLGIDTMPRDDNFDALTIADFNDDGVDEVVSVNPTNIGFLFPRLPLTCGGPCELSVKEEAGLDDRTLTKSDIREPLLFSRERGLQRHLERRVF